MRTVNSRRKFISGVALAGIGAGLTGYSGHPDTLPNVENHVPALQEGGRVGMIGLDTSHSTAFVESLNSEKSIPGLWGYRVVAAYPQGSRDIQSSYERIPQYTETVKKFGVEIVGSIEELLKKVDVVLLETNDGKMHLEQAVPVLKAGKRLFIDKPVAHSLADAIAIFKASEKYKTPVFSCSSLRYMPVVQDIAKGKIVGKVLGADTYSPCKLEKTHPDLFWYGIHGVETLFTLMGTGCKEVVRVHSSDADMVIGTWSDNRIGSYRGIRSGRDGYGGAVFGDKGIASIPPYSGYEPLLIQIVHFFRTGIPPVSQSETLEICAFMEAADESKRNGGRPIDVNALLKSRML